MVRLAGHGVIVCKAVICFSSLEGTGQPSGGRTMTPMAWARLSQPSKPMTGGSQRDVLCLFLMSLIKDMFPPGHREKVLGSISH